MDSSPFTTFNCAALAQLYLEELFYRRLSELAKSRPENFFLDDSKYFH